MDILDQRTKDFGLRIVKDRIYNAKVVNTVSRELEGDGQIGSVIQLSGSVPLKPDGQLSI